MKKQKGSVVYDGITFNYEVDNNGNVWIIQKSGTSSYGHLSKPLDENSSKEEIEKVVLEMLVKGGYLNN